MISDIQSGQKVLIIINIFYQPLNSINVVITNELRNLI